MEHSRLTIWSLFFSGSFMRKCICSEKTSSSSSRRLPDNGRLCHRKYENDLRIGGENHGDTDE